MQSLTIREFCPSYMGLGGNGRATFEGNPKHMAKIMGMTTGNSCKLPGLHKKL